MANLADRTEVMDAIIDWFGGCRVPSIETPTPTSTPTPTTTPTLTPTLTYYHVYLPLIMK
ncbi:MAG: hypothetical protein ISS50_02115 [Anaerolineae bacterium]|nr:hypothetical protein [Anaerolineae bacterium]